MEHLDEQEGRRRWDTLESFRFEDQNEHGFICADGI